GGSRSRRVHDGQPGVVPDVPGVDLRQQPDQRSGLGRGLAARAVCDLALPYGHHGDRNPAVAQDGRRLGHVVYRRTSRNAGKLMTTNTTSNAAADGTRQVTGSRGTSVVLQNLNRAFGATRALDG